MDYRRNHCGTQAIFRYLKLEMLDSITWSVGLKQYIEINGQTKILKLEKECKN